MHKNVSQCRITHMTSSETLFYTNNPPNLIPDREEKLFKMKLIGLVAVLLIAVTTVTTVTSQFTEDDAREFVDSLDGIFCDAGNAEMVARCQSFKKYSSSLIFG